MQGQQDLKYVQSIFYNRGDLRLIDQTVLPHRRELIQISDVNDAWRAIREMRVRGAPAIAIVACLSVAVEVSKRTELTSIELLSKFLRNSFEYLRTSRPTAVNLRNLTEQCYNYFEQLLKIHAESSANSVNTLKEEFIKYIEALFDDDVARNRRIGEHGADSILNLAGPTHSVHLLTHCNTGSLATCGYGTALGVIRQLNERGRLAHAFFTETRPYFQGARLTAFELVQEKIPSTMICDSMVGMLLSRAAVGKLPYIKATQEIESLSNEQAAVVAHSSDETQEKVNARFYAVVGADRIAANGDTANKIGTLTIALCAQHYGIPFFIAAPISTVDLNTKTGADIVIEERDADEMVRVAGIRIAADHVAVWNPSFDVTPNHLIAGIITEYGVFKPSELANRVQELREREAATAPNMAPL